MGPQAGVREDRPMHADEERAGSGSAQVDIWADQDGAVDADDEPALTQAEAEELWAMVHAAKAELVADVRGLEPVPAREAVAEVAWRATADEPYVLEPEARADGSLRVTVLLAFSDDSPGELLDEMLDRLGRDGWEVAPPAEDGGLTARWRPAEVPAAGIAELTLNVRLPADQ